MSFTPHPNFAYGTVTGAPDPADSGTTIVIGTTEFVSFLDPATYGSYPATIWPTGTIPFASNGEIVSVVAKGTNGTLNITREQESTTARTVEVGDQFAATFTKAVADEMSGWATASFDNYIKNGNFINNTSNGYGGTPENWTGSNANVVQGGFPVFGTQNIINAGVNGTAIQGLWNLDESAGTADAIDLSANSYNLSANGTPTVSADGLMGNARDFENTNSTYLSIADAGCANLQMAGDQTWFAFFQLESLGTNHTILSQRQDSDGHEKSLRVNTSNNLLFIMYETTAKSVTSSITLESNKWYFVCGVKNSSGLDLYTNCIKETQAGSFTADDINSAFAIGRLGNYDGFYMDGRIQNAGVLSVALTQSQIKQLWATTTYKGVKIRRSTSDANISQSLDEGLIEQLRGKTVSLSAYAYKDSADTEVLISIDDGTETESTALSSADSWEKLGVSKTISSTASAITVKLKASDSDGNAWFKEVALYESQQPLPYKHSADDVFRFNRLLSMDATDNVKTYRAEGNLAYKAGALTTTELTKNGQFGYDTTNNRLYLREAGTVKYVGMT